MVECVEVETPVETLQGFTHAFLSERFLYEPETGLLRYCMRIPYTTLAIGDVVGWKNNTGYMYTEINSIPVRLHRLIYFLVHGYVPHMLDHIDGIKINNRVENLRPVSYTLNRANSKRLSNNTSGFKGVVYDKRRQVYYARINKNFKRFHLGVFDNAIDAAHAYDTAAQLYFREFARTNF